MVNTNTQRQRAMEAKAANNERKKANTKRKLEALLKNRLENPVPKGSNMRYNSNQLKAAANAGRTRKSRKSRRSTRRRR